MHLAWTRGLVGANARPAGDFKMWDEDAEGVQKNGVAPFRATPLKNTTHTRRGLATRVVTR